VLKSQHCSSIQALTASGLEPEQSEEPVLPLAQAA
jgi:hypothetical protein